MNSRNIWILYAMELRSALRERAIVMYSILLPIFMYPIMLWVMFSAITFVQGLNEGFSSRIGLPQEPPKEHAAIVDSLEARPNVELVLEVEEDEAVSLIQAGEMDALLTFAPAEGEGAGLEDNFVARVRFDRSESRSRTARGRIQEVVEDYRDRWMVREAQALGVKDEDRVLFLLASENVSTEEDLGALILGMILPLFIIFMVAMGCFYPSVDTTAGERERSTWETLMTTSASRMEVVTAKYLYVATMGVTAGILNVVAMFVSMGAIMAPLLASEGDSIAFRMPLLAVPVMILGAVVIALMLSAAMMILAAFARTFKDGQAMIQPVYIAAVFIPILVGQQTDQTLSPSIAALPIANVVMMIRDAINGIFLWPFILESLAVNLVVVALCLLLARWVLQFEDFLMGSFDGSFWRFLKDRARRKKPEKEPV